MSELVAKNFLRALSNASRRIATGAPDSSVRDALVALEGATEVLVAGSDEAVFSVVGSALYLGPTVLAHTSTEFDGLIARFKDRRIDSVTVEAGASAGDLADLAALVGGASEDLPAGGSVRLNERRLRPSDLDIEPLHELRRSYSFTLDTLRDVSRGGSLDLDDVQEAVDEFIEGGAGDASSSMLLATVQNHDEITYYHSVNVCLLSMALGRFAGFGRDQIRSLGLGALLHDVGRVIVDEAALSNPGRLTNADWAQVRLHPQEGAATIMAASGPGQEVAAAVALEHHVRLDGGGYPDLGGKTPHLYSRIVAITDAYDAITSFRPYRPARTPNEALRVLLEGVGSAYDPDLLRLFIQMTGEYPPGSLLVIDTGQIVMVTDVSNDSPRGLVVRSAQGEVLGTPEPIDLAGHVIQSQMLADEAGVDPGELLESAEQVEPVER